MTRTAILLLLLALPALAQAETVSGEVRVTGRKIELVGKDRVLRLTGLLADTVKNFAGHSVELTGVLGRRTFRADRIVSPVRDEKTLTARAKGGSWTLSGPEETFEAFGRVDLLTSGHEATVELWVFPAEPDGRRVAYVTAIEATTRNDWTLLSTTYYGYTVYTGFVRGQNRSVWVVDKRAGELYVRRGDDAGWVPAGELRVGRAIREGMSDRVGAR